MEKFWKWNNLGATPDEKRVLRLEGEIASESWWGDEVTPKQFEKELNSGNGEVEIWINSPGGDCIAASQIYTMLQRYEGATTAIITGIAASAASVIAMATDRLLMSPTSMLMIHNPWTWAAGDSEELQKVAKSLETVKDSIMEAYTIKTGKSKKELSDLMDGETWFSAQQAIAERFADGMTERDFKPETTQNRMKWSSRVSMVALLNKLNPEQGQPKTVEYDVAELLSDLNRRKSRI